ncbi:MAG: YigZ family protein [Pseudomonadota bacterium]|nr:YigZ family protein [Pseudomonadota bacterium]
MSSKLVAIQTSMSYLEPVNTSHQEIEIKKSRFISYAKKVRNRKEAINYVLELRVQYPDARHICWGYLIGDPNNSTNSGCNDDGEPSGTAGKPILAQINYSNIGNVVVVVVRYFGGIRLGAGGLVRAYRESTQQALLALETEEFVPYENITIELPFNEENAIRQLISKLDGEIISSDYGLMVIITALLPCSKIPKLELSLGNAAASIHKTLN